MTDSKEKDVGFVRPSNQNTGTSNFVRPSTQSTGTFVRPSTQVNTQVDPQDDPQDDEVKDASTTRVGTDDYIKREKVKERTGTSLLPIKGISGVMKNRLRKVGLSDIPSLLVYGRTVAKRKELANALGVSPGYVDSWVKQADLWRVPGMTPDAAYLLVQAGVRCIEDLSMLDGELIWPLLISLSNAQPDFTPPDFGKLFELIGQASTMVLSARPDASFYKMEFSKDDLPPAHLMVKGKVNTGSPQGENYSAIKNGIQSLESLGLDRFSPLPSKICGQVVCKREGQLVGVPDQLVEISGYLSSNRDQTDNSPVPSSYTDAKGRFELNMPDAYCFKEVVTFTVRAKDAGYTFNKNATEIISKATKNKDGKTVAELGSPFIIDGTHIETAVPARALPEVALMGEGDKAVRLSSDTAPSRIYKYKILSRLVEPKLADAKSTTSTNRYTITQALDVDQFKGMLSMRPKELRKMSSLGIGYVLNMHQAWVPDGFALGSLLYSLILAPGEEQRIIVREREQSYEIGDEASAADITRESYELAQKDNEDSAYDYALKQLSKGGSSYSATSNTSSAGASGGLGGLVDSISFGLSVGGGWSSTSSSGKSSAYQSNAHNEASSVAQNFQHAIKSASERIAQAKRVSIRTASGDEAEGVSSKIIANHNHSHVMTVQYWEVMRRYKVETAVDGVDMVLFVPMELIDFLPYESINGGQYKLMYYMKKDEMNNFRPGRLKERYRTVLKYYDVLYDALPWKYRYGLERMRYYSELPQWTAEKVYDQERERFVVWVSGNFLYYDNVTLKINLKWGKGSVEGMLNKSVEISESLRNEVSSATTKNGVKEIFRKYKRRASVILKFEVILPDNCTIYDLYSITLENHPEPQSGRLRYDYASLPRWEQEAIKNYEHKMENLYEDAKSIGRDLEKIAHYSQGLPECYTNPDWKLSEGDLQSLEETRFIIDKISYTLEDIDGARPDVRLDFDRGALRSRTTLYFMTSSAVLRHSELLRMEETFHYILSNEVRYSQAVWSSLSADELAIMLEKYTVDMSQDGSSGESIPLLNCVNVASPLGFYGTCFLFPFTMPEGLSERLHSSVLSDGRMSVTENEQGETVVYKTEKDWQDALYNYHTNSFRVPTTVISLPTDGMVGEAVLGETNVSELIDLTRFWKWDDADIDHVSLDNNYLKSGNMLSGLSTAGFVDTAKVSSAPSGVDVPNLLKALTEKKTPEFDNMTGQEQLAAIINKVTNSAATGRDKIVEANTKLTQAALEGITSFTISDIKAKAASNANTGQDGVQGGSKDGGQGNTEQNQSDQNQNVTNSNGGRGNGSQEQEQMSFKVNDVFPIPIAQKNGDWAAMMAMIQSWKKKASIPPETMLRDSGDKKILNKFLNDKMPDYTDIREFLPKIGMTVDSRSLSGEAFYKMLTEYGPLLMCLAPIGQDEADKTGFCVITGIRQNGDNYYLESMKQDSYSPTELDLDWVLARYKLLMNDKNKAGLGLMHLSEK